MPGGINVSIIGYQKHQELYASIIGQFSRILIKMRNAHAKYTAQHEHTTHYYCISYQKPCSVISTTVMVILNTSN